MQKRQIRVQILPNGELKIDNAGNPDEARILKELSELSALLNGEAQGYKIEQHVHSHGHAHTHEHTHAGH